MTFIDYFTCITKICILYLQPNKNISLSDKYLFQTKCRYVPETLMQKNNMGILGNDMRIK